MSKTFHLKCRSLSYTNINLKTAFFQKDGAHTDSYLRNTPRSHGWVTTSDVVLWYHLFCQAPVWLQTTACCWDQCVQVDRNCRNMRGAVRERELSQCLLLKPSLNVCIEWLPHLYYADVFRRMCSTMAQWLCWRAQNASFSAPGAAHQCCAPTRFCRGAYNKFQQRTELFAFLWLKVSYNYIHTLSYQFIVQYINISHILCGLSEYPVSSGAQCFLIDFVYVCTKLHGSVQESHANWNLEFHWIPGTKTCIGPGMKW